MKQADIDRLKEMLGDEFEVLNQNSDENDKFFVVIVTKKDPWEGVEFVECLEWVMGGSFKKGDIYPMDEIKKFAESGIELNGEEKKCFKPSTEAEYVEQLKREAFERYGEIKEGTKFDRSEMGFIVQQTTDVIRNSEKGFNYQKEYNQLFFGDISIYNSGKWAKKLPERVHVKCARVELSENGKLIVNLILPNSRVIKSNRDTGYFLASQLEKYLNNEK